MSETEQAKCLACNQGLFVYVSQEVTGLHFDYCDNDKCSRYKLVTIQEDI